MNYLLFLLDGEKSFGNKILMPFLSMMFFLRKIYLGDFDFLLKSFLGNEIDVNQIKWRKPLSYFLLFSSCVTVEIVLDLLYQNTYGESFNRRLKGFFKEFYFFMKILLLKNQEILNKLRNIIFDVGWTSIFRSFEQTTQFEFKFLFIIFKNIFLVKF